MKILAIETSCDETAISILECSGDVNNPSFEVLANKVVSQIDIHKEYGGVYPTLAKREHSKNLLPVLMEVLEEANFSKLKVKSEKLKVNETQIQNIEKILEREPDMAKALLAASPVSPDINAIAVTIGPGLAPALWVGVNFAKALSYLWDKPLIPVNHMEGHLLSILLKGQNKSQITNDKSQEIQFPLLGLLVSGNHTELVLAKGFGKYRKLGQTRDDAAGEAFDKVARMMDLEYPGGPKISKLAREARDKNLTNESITLPRPMINSADYDFSFSGLKTAVLYMTQEIELSEETKQMLSKEFEDAVIDVLIAKTQRAVKEHGVKTLVIGGGVTANSELRRRLTEFAENQEDLSLYLPDMSVTMDNAIMIAIAGYIEWMLNSERFSTYNFEDLRANANLSL